MPPKKKSIWSGLDVGGAVAIFTAVITIGVSIPAGLLDPATHPTAYTICDRAFYVGLTLLLVELLYNFFYLKKSTEELADKLHVGDSIIFPRENAKLEAFLEEALQNPKTKKVQIICYGTSKYARIIKKLEDEEYHHISAEVIVFSPDITVLGFTKDQDKLRSVINSIRADNIHIHACSILPTIRGSSFRKANDDPLFCTIQPYIIDPDPGSDVLMKGKNVTPALIAQGENNQTLLDLDMCFKKEFRRLKAHSTEVTQASQPSPATAIVVNP